MNVKFKTDQLLDDDETCLFSGHVIVNVPPHNVRAKFLFDSGIPELAGMKDDDASRLERASKMAEATAKGSEMVFKHITSCDLVHEDGETVLKTADELWSHPDASILVDNLILKFVTNFTSGKTKPSAKGS